jgi:hypothetical protein
VRWTERDREGEIGVSESESEGDTGVRQMGKRRDCEAIN